MKINEFNKILYFKVAAEELSYTKAAKKLEATPSGVQKAVKSLEESLSIKLFVRKFRGLYLTPEGKILLDRAIKSLKELEFAKKEILSKRKKAEIKKIKLLTTPGMAGEWIYSCLPPIREIYPNIITELYSSNLEISLESGDFDIYIGPYVDTSSDYSSLQLGIVNFRLYCSNIYAEKHGIPKKIENLKGHTLIKFSGLLQAYFSEANNAFSDIDDDENYTFIVDSYLAEYNLVRSGAGIACLSKEFVEKKDSDSIIDIFPKMKSISIPMFMFFNKKEDKVVIESLYNILKKNVLFIV